jgi:hypothetical protein
MRTQKALKSGSAKGRRASAVVVTYASEAVLRKRIEESANNAGLIGDVRAAVVASVIRCEGHARTTRRIGVDVRTDMVRAFGAHKVKRGAAKRPPADLWFTCLRAIVKVSPYTAKVWRTIGREWWQGNLPHKGHGKGGVKGQNTLKTLRGLSSKMERLVEYATHKGFKETCPVDVYTRFLALVKEASALREIVEERKEAEIAARDEEKAA